MKLLTTITEESLGLTPTNTSGRTIELRDSARGILFNDKNEVSIQFVSKHNYYKLPGGGVENGETKEDALRREIIEEVGCDITIEKEIGFIKQHITKFNLLHTSYGYIARVKGPIGEPSYEQGEIDDGFKPIWVSLEKALELTDPNRPLDHYEGKFLVKRENTFLNEAKRLLG